MGLRGAADQLLMECKLVSLAAMCFALSKHKE